MNCKKKHVQMLKIKRYLLEDSLETPLEMYGVFCHHNAYRLAWQLNRDLHFYFQQKNNSYFPFPLFQSYDRINRTIYSLVQNKNNNQRFIIEKPYIDYLLTVHAELSDSNTTLIERLRTIPSILLIYSLSIDEIPSIKDSVLYFME